MEASAPSPTLNGSCTTSRRWSRTWRGRRLARTPLPLEEGGLWCAGALPTQDFSQPDTRSGVRFLGWLLWQQLPVLLLSSLISVIEWLPGSVGPYLVGKIVDEGIIRATWRPSVRLSLIMFGLVIIGIIASVLGHTVVVRTWLVAMYGSMKLVTRKATQMGHVLPQRTPTGEVLSVSAGDSDEFGALTEVVSRFVGALIAYLVIAGLVLSTSLKLGIVVLVTAPLIVLFAMPLLRPLQRREEIERNRTSDLTSMATDIVGGLRILRGIGGEQTFARNYTEQSQVHPAGRRLGWCLAGRRRCDKRAVLRAVPGRPDLAGCPRGRRRRPERRPVDQFLRLRDLHGVADPDVLRAGAEVGPQRGLGAQGRCRAGPAAAVAAPLVSR